MKNNFLFFLIILNILDFTDSYLLAECLTFKNAEGHRTTESNCWRHAETSTMELNRHPNNCMKCQINDTKARPDNKCGSSLRCLSLIFHHNSLFEQFSDQFSTLTDQLLKSDPHPDQPNALIITLQNYDLTEISFQYLKSILRINSPSYQVLHVIFIKSNTSQSLIKIIQDFQEIPIRIIYLSFSCNHLMEDRNWIEYVIRTPNTTPKIIKFCGTEQSRSSITKSM